MIKIDSSNKSASALRSIKNIDRATVRAIRQGMFTAGDVLVKEAKEQIMHKPKSGRVYKIRRGKRRVKHRASAPFESPANLSGTLRKSIYYKIRSWHQLEFGSGKGDVEYAKYLEEGTSKMKPRPVLLNSLKEKEGELQSIFEKSLRSNLT